MTRNVIFSGFFGLTIVLALGCSGGENTGPQTVAVSGTVSLDDQPLEGAHVYFIASDGKFTSFGLTDANGKYSLDRGALPGKNKVVISKKNADEGEVNVEEGIDPGQMEAAKEAAGDHAKHAEPEELIPDTYSDPAKTTLTFDVGEGGTNQADFRLTSK